MKASWAVAARTVGEAPAAYYNNGHSCDLFILNVRRSPSQQTPGALPDVLARSRALQGRIAR